MGSPFGNAFANPMLWILIVAVLSLVAVSLVPFFSRPSTPANDEFWRGGILYVNRDDPALFVPKRYGTGYTLNFGNRWSWVVMALILVLALAPIVLSINALRHVSKFR